MSMGKQNEKYWMCYFYIVIAIIYDYALLKLKTYKSGVRFSRT